MTPELALELLSEWVESLLEAPQSPAPDVSEASFTPEHRAALIAIKQRLDAVIESTSHTLAELTPPSQTRSTLRFTSPPASSLTIDL